MNPVLVLLSGSAALVGLSIRGIEPMLPALAAEFSVPIPVAAQVITFFALLYAFGQFLHGPLGDRYGRLPVIAFMLVGASVTFLGCALAPNLTSLTAWRAVAGIFVSAPFILGMAYIGDTVPLEHRQMTIAQFVTGNVIGHACGPLASGIITDALGWRALFYLLTALFAIMGVTMHFVARRERARDRRSSSQGNPLASYLQVLRIRKVQVLAWASFAEAFFFFGAYAYVGAMLKQRFDLSYTLIGLALAGLGLGGLAFNTSIRWMIRRFPPPRMVLVGGVGCGTVYVAIALLPFWQPIYALMSALGFTFYMLHNLLQTRATEASPHARGIGMSVFGVAWTLGQSIGVALMGGAISLAGIAPMIVVFGIGFAMLGAWMRFNLGKLP